MMPYFLIREDDKYGFVEQNGRTAIPCDWDFATDFSDGVAIVCAGNEWFLLGEASETLTAVPEEVAVGLLGGFSEGFACFKDAEGRRGYVSSMGVVAIRPRFEFAGKFGDGLAPVKEFGHAHGWGFIDREGRWAFGSRFEAAFSFKNGLARAKHSGKVGFIDRDGKWKIQPNFADARPFSEGLAAVCFRDESFEIGGKATEHQALKGSWGYIKQDGTVAIEARYLNAGPFSEKRASIAVLEGSPYMADCDLVVPCHYSYIASSGGDVFKRRWSEAWRYSEGRAAVAVGGCYVMESGLVGGRWGFINENGRDVGKIVYGCVEEFRNGLARVYRAVTLGRRGSPYEDDFQYVDRSGEVVWSCR